MHRLCGLKDTVNGIEVDCNFSEIYYLPSYNDCINKLSNLINNIKIDVSRISANNKTNHIIILTHCTFIIKVSIYQINIKVQI